MRKDEYVELKNEITLDYFSISSPHSLYHHHRRVPSIAYPLWLYILVYMFNFLKWPLRSTSPYPILLMYCLWIFKLAGFLGQRVRGIHKSKIFTGIKSRQLWFETYLPRYGIGFNVECGFICVNVFFFLCVHSAWLSSMGFDRFIGARSLFGGIYVWTFSVGVSQKCVIALSAKHSAV